MSLWGPNSSIINYQKMTWAPIPQYIWFLGTGRDVEFVVSQTGCEASAVGGLAAKAMAFAGQVQKVG